MEDPRDDLALASAAWLRGLEPWIRSALLEQRALRVRGRRKHSRADEMLFTPLGLQQMTPEPLAKYKAGRLPSGLGSLADLCCGLGGDSWPIPPGIFLCGVDIDRDALIAYHRNVGLSRPAVPVCADATSFPNRVEGILLDPARRTLESMAGPRDFDADPEPGWDAVLSLVGRFGNAAVKLGPGARIPEALAEQEREFLGWRDECLELTVRTGAFGRPGWVRAVELPSGAWIEASSEDAEAGVDRVEAPGTYLFEPVKCVIRAHLFGVLARREGLWQLDPRTAYLSGDRPVDSPLLKRYRIVRILPHDEALLRREVAKHEIGVLEIKKRGLELDPESWRKRLKPKGPNAATLVFTRVEGKGAVLWVEPERG